MSNNEMSEAEKLANSAADNRIAAVRDLIFGENIQQYSKEFDDVYQKINELKEEASQQRSEMNSAIDNRINQLEATLLQAIEDLKAATTKRMDDLDDKKADRRKLGKALEKIGQTLQA